MAAAAGSVSVSTNSVVVTGQLTSFVAAEGDQFVLRGVTAVIARLISPSQLQLKRPWPGPDMVGASDWDISLTGPYWQSSVVTNRRLTDLLNKFEAGPIKWDAAGSPADRVNYNNQGVDFLYLSLGEPWTLYTKIANTGSASDWSPGQAIRGSPAESTAEAEAARDAALLSANQAGLASSTAVSSAATATDQASAAAGSASAAGSSAAAAQGSAGTAASQASIASDRASVATGQADVATQQAAAATSQAGVALDARRSAEAARDLVLPAVAQAQAYAATATSQAGTATQQADAAQLKAQQAADARDAALQQAAAAAVSAIEARTVIEIVGLNLYDFSFDSDATPSDDWSN